MIDPLTLTLESWEGHPKQADLGAREASSESGSGETARLVPGSSALRFSDEGTQLVAAGPMKADSSAAMRRPPNASVPALESSDHAPPKTRVATQPSMGYGAHDMVARRGRWLIDSPSVVSLPTDVADPSFKTTLPPTSFGARSSKPASTLPGEPTTAVLGNVTIRFQEDNKKARPRPGRAPRRQRSEKSMKCTSNRRRAQLCRAPLALLAAAIFAAALSSCGDATPSTGVALGDQAALAAAAANTVTVSPLPGTPDASPSTQISFLGGTGTQISSVRVVGSRSGVHSGRLEAYSTGTGESFLPAKPFSSGERVTVHATVVGSGQALSSAFTVAHQANVDEQEFPLGPGDSRAVQHYSSAPALTPSTVTVTTPAKPGAASGDLFMAPYQGNGSPGPMISEQNGALVWFHPLPAGYQATNFQVQQFEGKPALTWWQGRIIKVGFGQGEDVVYNSSYQQVARIRAGNGYHADLHEILLTPQGTAWIDAFDPIHMNLSSVHGSGAEGVLSDSIVEEIDIKTGLVMWEWHALGHIPLRDSLNAVPGGNYPWDYVHINSISPDPAGPAGGAGSNQPGDVLLSSRNTWTLYDVNMHTGGFNWLFGDGKRSSFKLGSGVRFYWQHDAEFQPGGLISVFDNGSDPPKQKESSGLLLRPQPRGTHGHPRQALCQPDQDAFGLESGQRPQPARR